MMRGEMATVELTVADLKLLITALTDVAETSGELAEHLLDVYDAVTEDEGEEGDNG